MIDEIGKVVQIPISNIDDPESPIRTRADECSINDLADSIRAVGLIQPILVRPRNSRYEVITGHRRLIACRIAGFFTVPCIVGDADDARTDALRLHENLGREDVNIIDQARFLARIKEQLKLDIAGVAAKIRRSETFVRDRLAVLDWPKEAREALDNQKLSFGALGWLAKITDESERRRLLSAAISSGITQRVAYDWYSRWKAGTMPKTELPPTKIEPETGEKVEYFTSRCRICGEPIEMGTEEVIYTHRKCIEEVERQMGAAS